MATKKGKSKPAKAKKTASEARRSAAGKSKRKINARPIRSTKRVGAKKRASGRLRRTEAGPVWIGNAAKPVNLPSDDRGSNKATGHSERVVIL